MIDQSPILIAAPPRSGTTMLAGLLHKHGIWVGNARKSSFPSSNCDFASENLDIKAIMKREAARIHYKNWHVPMPHHFYANNENVENIKKEIEVFVPQSTRWLVKTSWTLTFWEFWNKAYPKAIWLFPVRPALGILQSMNQHPRMCRRPDNLKKNFIKVLQERQKEVSKSVDNYLFINVMKLSKRDKGELNLLFGFLNIQPNWDIINNWIQPEMMVKR